MSAVLILFTHHPSVRVPAGSARLLMPDVFIRRIQIGDDIALTQILCELGVLVEQSGKRERFPGFRILQRFKGNPTTRVISGSFPAAEVAVLSALTGDATITSAAKYTDLSVVKEAGTRLK